uniref:Uncharacterized protein n=1 Tax=Anguilla anguilla TaxID=7936 RepID=A0A0E9SEN7_ANGAN
MVFMTAFPVEISSFVCESMITLTWNEPPVYYEYKTCVCKNIVEWVYLHDRTKTR